MDNSIKTSEQIRLLERQIDELDDLDKGENHVAFDAWHMQTGLLLKKILSVNADEVKRFYAMDGQPSVYVIDDDAEMARRMSEAYYADIKSVRSLLSGILYFLKSIEGPIDCAPLVVNVGNLDALHEKIKEKCYKLYLGGHYSEAVEKGFKVVRDKLRSLTTYETGSEAFGKGRLYIKGASAKNVDDDFQNAVKFLTMAIDQFRNEKSHTSDGNIDEPERAYEYLAISSLAMLLLDNGEINK